MRSVTMKTGDYVTVGEGTMIQIGHTNDNQVRLTIDTTDKISMIRGTEAESTDEEPLVRLRQLAQEVMAGISELDSAHTKELLGAFVSELFLSVAEQERREYRRQKQAEGIAAAKERGVQFGARRMELPDGFEDIAELWIEGGISAREAARLLGLSHVTFLRRAREYRAAR